MRERASVGRERAGGVWTMSRRAFVCERVEEGRIWSPRLRRKLEDDPSRPRHLLTEPGMGYRLHLSETEQPDAVHRDF